jgi:5'-3' exonuclease
VREAPLSALAGTRVGIDFNSYINKLLGADSFVAAVGGAPLALASQIEKDLQALEKANIKPVFVFSGIVAGDRQKLLADDNERKRRGQAWEHYEQGRVPQAQQDFGLSNPLVTQDVIRLAHRLFKLRTVEFVVSPYLSLAQLVYLEKHPKAYIHSMYGPHELFLFDGVDRVILNLNFNTSTISFASKSAILSDLGVTPDQFLDISILSGFDSSPTFPGLDPNQFAFRSVVDLVKGRVNGMNVVLTFKDYPPVFNVNYLDTFVRSRCMIKFSLVLVAPEGRVLPLPIALPALIPPPTNGAPSSLPLTTSDVPVDLYDIFSPRLPDEVYYQLFRGLIGSRFISALATGYLIESTPLCGGTQEYERFIKALTELPQSARCVAIGLISSSLHPMWSKKPVVRLCLCWLILLCIIS